MKDFTKNTIHYLPLVLIFIIAASGFLLFSFDRAFQIFVAMAVSVLYIFWGVIHHKVHDELDIFVVIEYTAVSALGLVVVLSLIFRS
jgi:hypothetical protein